ncbi:MAG TPA: zf-HC2 domain-containing protein, partial [Longimicrobiales bacterium]|nr:zf-HC2 domain-containing protein [Longimicrobiales bacterium]
MLESLTHPGFRQLNRYVDGDLGERERARVATHLARCERCHATVDKLRALGAAARELPEPAAPATLIEHALRRRAAGERVILPVTPPGAPRRRFSTPAAVAAAAVALLAVAAVLTLRAPSLEAARGGLTITPERPAPGALLTFDYQDMGRFQGQQQLTVRARYRTDEHSYQLTAGVLQRAADGHYRGTITLPDSVVYAAFAVEDPAGRTVDSNGRRLWDVMVHGPDGKPTFEALLARMNDLLTRDWERAFAVAKRMTEVYPDRPAAWASLQMFQAAVLDDSTVMQAHRKKLAALQQKLVTDGHADPEILAELAYYAFPLDEPATTDRLIRAIDAEHGWDRVRMQYRLTLLQIAAHHNDEHYLNALDSLWGATGGGPRLANAGYSASMQTGDPNTIWTWYTRLATTEPKTGVPTLIHDMAAKPHLRNRVA